MKHLLALTVLLTLLVPDHAVADDRPWSHARLASVEGYRIDIDFVATFVKSHDLKPQHRYLAGPIYLNVSGADLDADDRVRVVFNQYERVPPGVPYVGTRVPVTYVIDLVWQGDHFSQELSTAEVSIWGQDHSHLAGQPLTIHTYGYGGTVHYAQSVAVVINGVWLTDPMNGAHDFVLDLFDASSPGRRQ